MSENNDQEPVVIPDNPPMPDFPQFPPDRIEKGSDPRVIPQTTVLPDKEEKR